MCSSDLLSVLRVVAHWHDALIVVEETSRYCSPFHLPTEIETLIRYGRHSNLDQLYVARRPAEIHRDLTSNADFVATFRQWEPRDVQYLRSLVGMHGEIASTLPPYRTLIIGDVSKVPASVLVTAHAMVDTSNGCATLIPVAAPGV